MKSKRWQRVLIGTLLSGLVVAGSIAAYTRIASAIDRSRTVSGLANAAAGQAEAKKANAAHDIDFEQDLLEQAVTLDGSDQEHAEIQRRLAVLDWKYHARFDAARDRLSKAAATGAEVSQAYLAIARMEQVAENFDAALQAGRSALSAAATEREQRESQIAIGRAIVEAAVTERLEQRSARSEELDEAFALLTDLVRANPGHLETSRLWLRASLLLNRGPEALKAWRSYFHLAPGDPAPNAIAGAGHRLEALLPELSVQRAMDRTPLVTALADSRLFTEASLLALDPFQPVAADEIVAYTRFIRKLRRITDEFYRLTSIGAEDYGAYAAQLEAEGAALLPKLGYSGEFTPEVAMEICDEKFGALINLGRTAGYEDLHMGHCVVDERWTPEQYGKSADVRFMMLDNIVSNGFQSWAWESGAQHGGWGGETIVQIRPVYAGSALRAWRQITDTDEARELQEEIERDSARDTELADDDPYGYFAGMSQRLRLQGLRQLEAKLRERGLDGEQLQLAFYAAYDRALQASSIEAHEGRHAIDKAAGHAGDNTKKEFDAKLSEVVFAPEPRLAMGAIFSSNIGSGTAHGQANAKIMKGLHNWIEENASSLEQIDPTQPLLPQFDLLSDDQIRAAFRSLDPLAG